MTTRRPRQADLDHTRRLFDRDARSYHEQKYGPAGSVPQQYSFAVRRRLVVDLLGERPGRVLDVGCGPGVMIEPITRRGGTLTGVDLSPKMVQRAGERADMLGVGDRCRFETGSADALPFADGAFEAVVCAGVLEYVRDDLAALREMRRVVRPGGVVIVTVPNLLSPWRLLPVLLKPPFLRPLRGAFRRVRRRVLGRDACELDTFPRRLYLPAGLDRRMARAGLRKVAGIYYNFRLPVVGSVWPAGSVRLATALAPLARSPVLGFLGGGYIVRAQRSAMSGQRSALMANG